MTGKRSRGWSLQERAFAPAPEAQARSGGRGSDSHSGSDPQQLSSGRRDAHQQAAGQPLRRESLEAEATSAVRHSAKQAPCSILNPPQQPPQQQHGQQQHQQHQQAAERFQCGESGQPQPLQKHNRHSHQHHHHQPQHPPSCQQKAILPGVLASLVQAQRSSQRSFPPKPCRPPLGPSAPPKRSRQGDGRHVDRGPKPAADAEAEGVATSQHQGSSARQALSQHRSLHQQLQTRQRQQHRQSAQQRGGHSGRLASRHLTLQIPIADPVHLQLHSFFTRRRHQLRQLGRTPGRYKRPLQAGPRGGLLALPEDVLLKVICMLRHQEIGNLFAVCRELRATMDTAMMLHFNVLTPHHDHALDTGCTQGLPPRPAKREGSPAPSCGPANSADWDALPVRRTRPRALLFQDDVSESSIGGSGGDADGEVYPSTPLTPISIAS